MRLDIALSGLIVLVAVAAAWWFQPTAQPDLEPVTPQAPPQQHIVVHVAGAVSSPGLVQLVEGARVADAVAAAGGGLPDADLASVNLAAPVLDGQLVFIAEKGTGGPVGDGRLRLNLATLAEVEQLPGVGPVLAQRILDRRDVIGGFKEVEDLLDVSGIGESRLEDLRPLIVVP